MLRKGAITVFLLMLVLSLAMCTPEPIPPSSPPPTAAPTTATVIEPEPVIGVDEDDEDWGPEEEPWGDEFAPMVSFSVSGVGVPRTNITWAVVKLLTVKNGVEFQTNVDANGNRVDLDEDEDTSIRADTDDQIDVELGGVDTLVILPFPTSTTTTATVNILEVYGTTPAWTANTNEINGVVVDLAIGNANTGTHTVRGVMIDAITGDAQVTETGLEIGTGWDAAIDVNGLKIELDADADTSITADTDDQIDFEIAGQDMISFSVSAAHYLMDVYWRMPVAKKTASYTVTNADSGALITNMGATAEITLTLPAATAGLQYCIYVSDAYTITVALDGADQIHHLTNSAGDRLQNTGTAGDSVCLTAADGTYWLPLQEIGTWSDAN